MGHLAQIENAAVQKPVAYPPAEAGFGFLSVHAADGRVFHARHSLYALEDNPKSPFDARGRYHLVGLSGVGGMKSRLSHLASTLDA